MKEATLEWMLERAQLHVITPEETEEQRQSWARGEMALAKAESSMTTTLKPIGGSMGHDAEEAMAGRTLAQEFSAKFTNNPELQFQDIGDEDWREYLYPGGNTLTIKDPVALAVSVSSSAPKVGSQQSHRVVDHAGVCHYVSPGWLAVSWKVLSGRKPCSF